jgi:hypothetical protein
VVRRLDGTFVKNVLMRQRFERSRGLGHFHWKGDDGRGGREVDT